MILAKLKGRFYLTSIFSLTNIATDFKSFRVLSAHSHSMVPAGTAWLSNICDQQSNEEAQPTWWFAGDVVDNPVDRSDCVANACRDSSQEGWLKGVPICSHAIMAGHCSEGNHMAVRPLVAVHPNRPACADVHWSHPEHLDKRCKWSQPGDQTHGEAGQAGTFAKLTAHMSS